jgi:hypothetical protein
MWDSRGTNEGAKALLRESNEGADGVENFRDHPVGGVGVVFGNLRADFVEVAKGLRVEDIPVHAERRSRRA